MPNFDFFEDAQFITDQPAQNDEFSSQAHARVAKTLVNIVVTGDGGRAIGLEGTWGSGKSTVIDFALAQFEEWNSDGIPKQRVFVFDAWAHQGDPLRRVFLDELIEYLSQIRAVDKAKWHEKLERLRSIKKKTTETRAENLSWVARVTLLALPLFPLAYGLLLEATKKESQITAAISSGWLILVAISLIAAPYIAAFLTWLHRRKKPEMKGRSVIWAFNKQTDHVTTEQLIREDEATTVEFNREFDELISDAKERGNRIVIVLDNLDRLANDQIREIWATMRNFFAATPGSRRREILKNVWLIVPVDRQHIEAVFSEGVANSDEQRTRGFVEKTFEIVLRVPPLLLSSWSLFFAEKILAAFGEKVSPEERYRVFRLFELYQAAHPAPITPRAIKAYVNKLVGQAKLSGNSIPLEYQSLYVLYRDRISSELHKLQDSSILDAAVLASITDSNWTKYLAAAHFNVDPEQALEILLAPEIEGALLENKYERLNELAKTSGFISILHGVIAGKGEAWAQDNPTLLFNIAATLEKVDITSSPATGYIWRDLVSSIGLVSGAAAPTDLTVAGIRAIMGHTDAGRVKWAAQRTKEIFSATKREAGDLAWPSGLAWFRAMEALADAGKSMDQSEWDSMFSKIAIPPSPQFLFGVAEGSASSATLGLQKFLSGVSPDDLSASLATYLHIAEVPLNLQLVVPSLLNVPAWLNWDNFSTAIQNRLQQNDPSLNAKSAGRLLNILRIIAYRQKSAKNALAALNGDGSLHGILDLGRKESQYGLVGDILCDFASIRGENWVGPSEHPKYTQLGEVNEFLNQLQSDPEAFPEIVDAYSEAALKRVQFSIHIKLALSPEKNREIFRSVLRRMVARATTMQISPDEIISNFPALDKILGADLRGKMLLLLDGSDLPSALVEKGWMSLPVAMIVASKKQGLSKVSQFVSAINQGLNQMSSTEFLQMLKAEGNQLGLMLQLKEWGEISIGTTPLFDALNAYNKEFVEGTVSPSQYGGQWRFLPEILSESQRPHFYKGLRDLLVDTTLSQEILIRTIGLYGIEFLENAALLERDDMVLRRIITPLLASATKESLQCIEENSSSFRTVIESTSNQNREFIVERIEALIARSDESSKDDIFRIVELLGLASDLDRADEEAKAHVTAITQAHAEQEMKAPKE